MAPRRSKALPMIAPHDACYVCMRGDTTTCFAFHGNAVDHIVLRMKLGIESGEANATVRNEWGKRGNDQTVEDTDTYVVCQDCADRAELPQLYPTKQGTVIYPITVKDLTPGIPDPVDFP